MIRELLRAARRRHPRIPGRASLAELLGRPAPLPPDLGAVPGDDALLEDAPALRHLAAAGARGRARDLLRPPANPWPSAPDPSAFLAERHAAHAALPAPGPHRRLRILTFNVALLHRTYLGQTVASPRRAARRRPLTDAIFGGGYDVVFLQEVWNPPDAHWFARCAREAGYVVHTGERRYNHGLFLAARRDLVGREERDERLFATQYHLEGAPGPSIRRGFLRWTFDTPDVGRLTLLDTHTSAFPWASGRRNLQARELGRAARRPPDELVILGGDLNAALFYARDRDAAPGQEGTSGWWANAASVPLLLHYGGLDDLFNLAGPARDVERGRAVPPRGADPGEPMGVRGWCASAPRDTFTATECNSHYLAQYGGQELPARIDHLLLGDPGRRARVRSAAVVFTERLDLPGGRFELSDHYGVEAVLDVAKVG